MGQGWSTAHECPVFVSLGMVVLDELHFPNSDVLYDVLGGSGMYSTLGARLYEAGSRSAVVGCIIIAGCDFPERVVQQIRAWKVDLQLKIIPNQKSTRGILKYEDATFGRKTFAYISPPLRPSPTDLGTSSLLKAKIFHFLASPEELEEQISSLLLLREQHGLVDRPLMVWEPAPPTCERVRLESHLRACKLVDFFSPNHIELSYLVAGKENHEPPFASEQIELYGTQILESGIGPKADGAALIRCGEHGCLTLSASGARWLPPFYDPKSPRVVDPTGAGNAFLGGFAVGYQETRSLEEASIRGTVAASFALEQFGLPKFSPSSYLTTETWNGCVVSARLQEFKQRLLNLKL